MKIAICVTGGYYYNWIGGSRFYDWLDKFTSNNVDFIPYIISWQSHNNVPQKVKSQFGKQIKYRDNNGCDWGCYNYFVNYLKENDLTEEYDYIIFCHDDIFSRKEDWPKVMANHIDKNKEFDLVSFWGRYIKHPVEDFIASNIEGKDYTKDWMSMCFCVRANKYFFDNNPFVTIPGNIQDYSGDMGCGVVFANYLNMWGTEKIGWVCYDGVDKRPDYVDAVYHGKRGRSERIHKLNNCNDNDLQKVDFNLALSYGFKFSPGKLATHEKMDKNRIIKEN